MITRPDPEAADSSHHYQVNALAALVATRLAQGRGDEAATVLLRTRALLARLDNAPASTRDYVAGLVKRLCGGAMDAPRGCAEMR